MCEYCGCRQVEAIADLMDEHLALLDLAGDLRRALVAGHLDAARGSLSRLLPLLSSHVVAEEAGVFAALKEQGDFADEVEELEGEHVGLDAAFTGLDLSSPTVLEELDEAVADLRDHIDREDLGVFPVAVVTLGATGWSIVDAARSGRRAASV